MVDIFISRKASKPNSLDLYDYCTKYLLNSHTHTHNLKVELPLILIAQGPKKSCQLLSVIQNRQIILYYMPVKIVLFLFLTVPSLYFLFYISNACFFVRMWVFTLVAFSIFLGVRAKVLPPDTIGPNIALKVRGHHQLSPKRPGVIKWKMEPL